MTDEKAIQVYEPGQFAVLGDDDSVETALEFFKENEINHTTLTKLLVPAGGATTWELEGLGGPESHREITGVIAFARFGLRQWWREKIEAKSESTVPNCSSIDGVEGWGNNELSDADPEKHDCASCRWSQFGSTRREGGGKGQDCAESANLLFFRTDTFLPTLLRVPSSSLGSNKVPGVRGYIRRLIEFGRAPHAVVTSFSLEKVDGPPPHARIVFTHKGDLGPEEKARMKSLRVAVRDSFLKSLDARHAGAVERSREVKPEADDVEVEAKA